MLRTVVAEAAQAAHAGAVLTTDYETTAWLRFYEPAPDRRSQVDEPYRYLDAPVAAVWTGGPLLYVAERRRDQAPTC